MAGFFGKLPAKGDFLSRQLPREFLDPWDGWLQAAMHSSREQLGDAWLELYLTGPIWRFALSPGVCGADAWYGVMMPSVDRVGRYFPLTIAGSAGCGGNPFHLARIGADWFQRAEDLALSVLDEDQPGFEQFEAAVASLGDPAGAMQGGDAVDADLGESLTWRLPLSTSMDPSDSYPWLLRQLLAGRGDVLSLWWGDGAEGVEPSLCVCAGLPPAEGFAAMLNGQWADWSWQDPLGSARAAEDEASSAVIP